MISIQSINKKVYSNSFLIETFDRLFNFKNHPDLIPDIENITNFLICNYDEAISCFSLKVKNLDYLDEEIFLIYDEGCNIIGYCSIFPNRWNTSIFLNEMEIGIFISVLQRGKGYGSEVLNQLEQYIKLHYPLVDTLILAPKINNSKAINLYNRLGYEFEPNSLAFSQDMIYMTKKINSISNKEIQEDNPLLTKIIGPNSKDLIIGHSLVNLFRGYDVCSVTFWDDKDSPVTKTLSYYPNSKNYSIGLNPCDSNAESWKEPTREVWQLLKKLAASYNQIYLVDGLDALAFNLIDSQEFLNWINTLSNTQVYISGNTDQIFYNGTLIDGPITDCNLDISFTTINTVKIK